MEASFGIKRAGPGVKRKATTTNLSRKQDESVMSNLLSLMKAHGKEHEWFGDAQDAQTLGKSVRRAPRRAKGKGGNGVSKAPSAAAEVPA